MELVSKCFMVGAIKCCTSCMHVMNNLQLVVLKIVRTMHKEGR